MDSLSAQKRKAVVLGLTGLVLIVLGAKAARQLYAQLPQSLDLDSQPALLFFSLDEPCDCVKKLISEADFQINHWPEETRQGIPVLRFDLDQNRQLASQYEVVRAPSLLLLDQDGKVISRQDYPVIKNGPLDLSKFEADIKILFVTDGE
jgi:hypothetical protein